MIRGRKNFLPPHPLVMGFGVMFRLDESSLASHLNERRVRGEDEGPLEMEVESYKEQDNSDSDEQDIDVQDTSKETENHFNPIRQQPNEETDTITGFDSVIVTLTTEATSSNPPEAFSQDETGEGNFHAGRPLDIDDRIDTSGSSQLDLLIDKALGLRPAKLSNNNTVSDTHGSTEVESQTNEIKTSIGREKPYISKAERRKLKKGQNTSDAAKGSDENENDTSPANSQLDGNQKVRPVNPKITRGQKGKLKKIKEKYAEQDEEERRIRMALLAVS